MCVLRNVVILAVAKLVAAMVASVFVGVEMALVTSSAVAELN